MSMTATQPFDAPSPFALKQEKDDCLNENARDPEATVEEETDNDNDDDDDEEDDDDEYDNEDDDDDDDDAESISSLAQPSILVKDCSEFNDEFLRLTSMVRRVYFSYLHKSVVSNYNVGHGSDEKQVSKSSLKKFAAGMELCAVKASLEASLYRQTMLKMISDIKKSTCGEKIYKRLAVFLQRPSGGVDVAVQTGEPRCLTKDATRVRSTCVTSNFPENATQRKQDEREEKSIKNKTSETSKKQVAGSTNKETILNSICERDKSHETRKIKVKREDETPPPPPPLPQPPPQSPADDDKRPKSFPNATTVVDQLLNSEEPRGNRDEAKFDIFESETMTEPPLQTSSKNEDDGSQDSLMQHLEDMFCESDDSSDLMSLIEKHSGVSKANVDSEIGKLCAEESPPVAMSRANFGSKLENMRNGETTVATTTTTTTMTTTTTTTTTSNKRKLSFSNYKKMKKRAMVGVETPPHEETSEEKQNRKNRGIWFVERVHQVSKLEAKMLELSMKNYRKHGRLCAKFIELFGDPDEEETMPESPIRIEEHLTACKERIAPWVVKHLMPYYTSGVIKNRLLFKALAKHIADMLIIENTFPEENCVGTYVKDYFRNKNSIKAEPDIYV